MTESEQQKVKAIRLQNFMAFEDTGWIELRPITLLFGKNSSGKSAIIRALRLLKQSLDAKPEDGALRLVSEQGVNVGEFQDVIFRGATTNVITFGFRCDIVAQWELLLKQLPNAVQENLREPVANLSLSFAWNKDAGQRVELSGIQLSLPARPEGNTVEQILFRAERSDREAPDPNKPFTPEEADARGDSRAQALGVDKNAEPWKSHPVLLTPQEDSDIVEKALRVEQGFLPVLELMPQTTSSILSPGAELVSTILTAFKEQIESFLQTMNWISPLRPVPQRTYYIHSTVRQQWEQRGLSAMLKFIEGGDEQSYKEAGNWLDRLGLGKELLLPKSAGLGGAKLSQVELRENDHDEKGMNLTDVGFGASQVIPIILQSLFADHGQLVIIEQPELHLHPSAQAELADLFIEVAAINKGKAEIGKAKALFLIETHSEVLLLRVMRRIAEETSRRRAVSDNEENSDDRSHYEAVIMHFAHREESKSELDHVYLDQAGNLREVPKGFEDFFMDDMKETVARIKAERNKE